MKIESFVAGEWKSGEGTGREVLHAVTGERIGEVSSNGIDVAGMLSYGRNVGNPGLRSMTMHERGRMLKALAGYLMERKEEFYALSPQTGATKGDSWIDIEGGIGTLFVYASKGRREVGDDLFLYDGPVEVLSKSGTFVGTHICVPLTGVAVHINAFNFPCWGMLEKLAPTWLAGMPAIVKPATATSYLTQKMVAVMLESGLLPDGALQILCGDVQDLLSHLTSQDVLTLTGSAETGRKLRSHPSIIENSVRFNMETDSLNCSILGEDVTPEAEEFELFIREVAKEMTVKAGQKCTAIRRVLVPKTQMESVADALVKKLGEVTAGDPGVKGVRMGPLVSKRQVEDVREKVKILQQEAEVVFAGSCEFTAGDVDVSNGAFFPVTLLSCENPADNGVVHGVEAFGPVSTLIPFESTGHAVRLANLGQGSLCASVFTGRDDLAREIVLGIGPYHGRVMILNRHSAGESTGHGSPLPHLAHGGPGRAGGGEEMGGLRGLQLYLQRVALQGSPDTLGVICNQWFRGGSRHEGPKHPFRRTFDEVELGESLISDRRIVSEQDVVKFADLSGDHFYAHMSDEEARRGIFDARVAHGYFLVSAAAGLFVDSAFGPVLANYGLENLRFLEPVYFGDEIYVKFTCMRKTMREKRDDQPQCGVVEWDVEICNQRDEPVALYSILTLVACQ